MNNVKFVKSCKTFPPLLTMASIKKDLNSLDYWRGQYAMKFSDAKRAVLA